MSETKKCKQCQSEIDKKAKICPNCRKKQGGGLKFIVIGIAAIAIIGALTSQGEKDGQSKSNTGNQTEPTLSANSSPTEAVSSPKEEATPTPTSIPTPTEEADTFSDVETIYQLSNGHYTAGIDLPVGKCNLTAISGDGNVSSSNMFSGGINEMFGTDEANTGYYAGEFNGLKMDKGVVLNISSGVTIQLEYTKITGRYTGRSYDEENTITISNGNYDIGDDIPAGIYNVKAVSGDGNINSSNMFDGGINEMFGTDDNNTGYYSSAFANLPLSDGDTLEISNGVTVELIPTK